MKQLSVLIPSLRDRGEFLYLLRKKIHDQLQAINAFDEVEVLTQVDNGEQTIGAKRNNLLKRANGRYVCFIDDDDTISDNYFKYVLNGIKNNPDCCSLTGIITWDGGNPEIFEHSIKYTHYKTNETGTVKYERYPNHLNVIKADIAKDFQFEEINHGEDTLWATKIHESGRLKNEFYIVEVLYHYQYRKK